MATLVAWVPESTWPLPLAELIGRPNGRKTGMVQNACHSGDSSGPLDGSGVLQRLLPAAERRNFIAWRREPQGRCRRERTTNPLDPNPKRGRQRNASRTWGRL